MQFIRYPEKGKTDFCGLHTSTLDKENRFTAENVGLFPITAEGRGMAWVSYCTVC